MASPFLPKQFGVAAAHVVGVEGGRVAGFGWRDARYGRGQFARRPDDRHALGGVIRRENLDAGFGKRSEPAFEFADCLLLHQCAGGVVNRGVDFAAAGIEHRRAQRGGSERRDGAQVGDAGGRLSQRFG